MEKLGIPTLDLLARASSNRRLRRNMEVDLEFIIRRCQIGDENALSLLGKATFLETSAGSAGAADILTYPETEHTSESYMHWLAS